MLITRPSAFSQVKYRFAGPYEAVQDIDWQKNVQEYPAVVSYSQILEPVSQGEYGDDVSTDSEYDVK